ncbi:MAG: hypothetical protein OXB98_19420 [Bryobacterales bacterium]|nr:hypothetical protein [Bryobacterales bacterium]
MKAGATNRAKIHVQFEARLEPSGDRTQARRLGGGGVMASDYVIHRYMQDRSHKTYFGYDIAVEPLQDGSTLRVSILPLSAGPERLGLENPETWKKLAPPRYPPPQWVRSGDTLAFDLFVNPETGQKLVEYVLFGRNHRRETVAGPARDFTVHDAEIRLRAPRLVVNGTLAEATASMDGMISGPFVKLYWAPKGQFTFSLVPHPELGFRKLGEVRGSTAAFESGGDSYELNSEGKIAPGSAAFNLYVLHDPDYRPPIYRGTEFFMGASDKP